VLEARQDIPCAFSPKSSAAHPCVSSSRVSRAVQARPITTCARLSALLHLSPYASISLSGKPKRQRRSPLIARCAPAPPAARRHIATITRAHPTTNQTTTTTACSATLSLPSLHVVTLTLSICSLTTREQSISSHLLLGQLLITTTTMFDDNFTFAFSRSPSWASSNASSTREPSRSVSPCSPLSAFPPPPQRYSVTDLAADLDRQRIRPEARIHYQPCDSYANTTDDDSAWDLPALCSDSEADSTYSGSITATSCTATLGRVRAAPTRSYSPTRRVQRQSGTRMLCASQHHAKDIADLVSRMLSSSEQCSVVPPPDAIPTHEEADDEGYNSANAGDEPVTKPCRSTMSRRDIRAFDSRKSLGSAAIAKDIRFRAKDRGHRRHRSSGGKTSSS
jgi:hypothetical protein